MACENQVWKTFECFRFGMSASFSKETEDSTYSLFVYKIINGLSNVAFECVLIEAYKGTIRKHNEKFRAIVHIPLQYGQ